MKEVLAVSAVAVFAAVCGALVKKSNREIALLFSVAAAVLVFLYILPHTEQLSEAVGLLAGEESLAGVFDALLKALGIVLTGRIASEVCKDSGENALASGVEFAVKTAVLLAAFPLLQSLTEILREVLAL